MNPDDLSLLREYAATYSEPAFATLVTRHMALVYSAALRQVQDPHLAQDITQAVFIILARKAASLGPGTILSAWLYRTARYVAAETIRTQRRRAQREQEAAMQSNLTRPNDTAWHQISPWLDTAMASLGETDRAALVLRFFENKTAAEIAATLKVSEEAAQKRVTRALEKLRRIFNRKGVTLSAAIIAAALGANAVQAAPPALAAAVTAIALTEGALIGVSTLTLVEGALKLMAWTKIKTTAVIAAAVLLAVGTTTLIAGKLIGSPDPNSENLQPGTFVNVPGIYHWANPTATGELIFRNNQTRSITLGTSQEPPAGTRILNYWTNAPSESKLTIRSNQVKLAASDGSHSSSATIATWNPRTNWFVYRANGMRVWAYDGDRGLWMVTATPHGSESTPVSDLQEPVPGPVLNRLPHEVKRLMSVQ